MQENDRATNRAFVEFATRKHFKIALSKNKTQMGEGADGMACHCCFFFVVLDFTGVINLFALFAL